MSKRLIIYLVLVMAVGVVGVWAQDTTTQPSDASQSGQPQQPYPAYGQQNLPSAINENPPLSGMDMPSLEPNAAPLSYLQPGATFSEAADSNAAVAPGAQSFSSVSRALGNLTLRRLWSNYDLGLEYQGGVGYYSLGKQGAKLLQEMDFSQKVLWKRGQLTVRDSFSYLPEGNFGASYGSLGGVNSGALTGAFGLQGSALGAFGLVPRILNVSAGEITENLTPKSSVTATGGYGFTHFYGSAATGQGLANNTSFIGTSQITAQGGYNRVLTTHTQVALVYAYQDFNFSVAGAAFHTHVIQGLYGRRLSGRLDLLLGAGPQITETSACFILFQACLAHQTDTRLGVAGVFRLRYRFPKTMLSLNYHRYQTSGSGFFAGAQSDVAEASVDRPITRVWSGFANIGYSSNHRLQNLGTAQAGVNANTYRYGFVGGGLHRQFGHNFHGFFSYQFNELAFDHSYCGVLSQCDRISHRQVITLGVDWTPRPIRLD